jgi:ubiquinone/menaquinone biosynthesis C-methylase UbiE
MKLNLIQNIYEQENVFGDESKLGNNNNRFEKMLEAVEFVKTPKTILDIGCGTGFFSAKLNTLYPKSRIYGIDISHKALRYAKQKYKNIYFKWADAEKKLPYPDNYFDLVVSGEHIEHIVDTDNYLSEINRVMNDRGYLLLTTPNLASWYNRIFLLLGKQPYKTEASYRRTLPIFSLFGYTFPENLSTPAVGHIRIMTLDMLEKLLNYYGFSIESKLGRTMLTKLILRSIDNCISQYPALASGLVIRARKFSIQKRFIHNSLA